MSISLVLLAAGKGTRMKSDLPKVLHPIAHAPMLAHAMGAAAHLNPDRTVVVAGHGFDAVETAALAIDEAAIVVEQAEQLGTAHAVDQAREALTGVGGDVVVLYSDTPFVSPDTLDRMVAEAEKMGADAIVGTRMQTSSIARGSSEIVAYGTAVRLAPAG